MLTLLKSSYKVGLHMTEKGVMGKGKRRRREVEGGLNCKAATHLRAEVQEILVTKEKTYVIHHGTLFHA